MRQTVRGWGLLYALLLLSASAAGEAPPRPSQVTLESGLTLLTVESPARPIVAISVLVRAGSLEEPAEKAGLANLAGELLTHGTLTRSAREISEEVDFRGASLSVDVDADFVTVDLLLLKKDLPTGLDILADVLTRPIFAEEEIRRKLTEIRGALRKKKEEPGQIAREAFAAELFGAHAYGRPIEGTEESLGRISREDLQRFHLAYYRPERMIVGVSGDITHQEMEAFFRSRFPSPPSRAVVPEIPSVGPKPARPLPLIVLPKKVSQAHVILGHLGISRKDSDYYAVSIMNYILGGGGLSSRLMGVIRDKHGWAYDVRSEFAARLLPGPFRVSLQTKNENVADAVRVVVEEITRMREEGPTEEEFREAQAYLTGSFPLRVDTNKEMASFLTAVEFYGLGLDYADRYPGLISQVTREDVLRVARKYLDPARLVHVIVGDPQRLPPPLGVAHKEGQAP